MSIQLSREQQEQIAAAGEKAIQAVHPATQKVYYIVPGDLYERIWRLLGDDSFDISDTYAAQESALSRLWDDPELDEYNDYDAHKPQ